MKELVWLLALIKPFLLIQAQLRGMPSITIYTQN